MTAYWIAVDWGTTNFRAFLMENTSLIDEISATKGILSVADHQFESVLQANIFKWLERFPTIPILMAGMIGSQQGWFNVPYQSLPANGKNLAENTYSFQAKWGSQIWIVPGVSGASAYDLPDVMRGEETQLIGLSQLAEHADNYVILPGTHSKHSFIQGETIEEFTSFMTGELFSLLMTASMIGKELPEQINNDEFFLSGVEQAQKSIPFTHLIFSARSKRLNQDIPSQYISSYLSGLLIGYELSHIHSQSQVWVISNQALGILYTKAGQHLALNLQHISGTDCFLQGAFLLLNYLGALQ